MLIGLLKVTHRKLLAQDHNWDFMTPCILGGQNYSFSLYTSSRTFFFLFLNFDDFIWGKLMAYDRERDIKWSFFFLVCWFVFGIRSGIWTVSFIYLKLRRELRNFTWRWGKSKTGIGLQDNKEIVFSLECGYFKDVLASVHRNNRQGFLKAQINFLLKKFYMPVAWLCTMTCPVRNLWSNNRVRLPSIESPPTLFFFIQFPPLVINQSEGHIDDQLSAWIEWSHRARKAHSSPSTFYWEII